MMGKLITPGASELADLFLEHHFKDFRPDAPFPGAYSLRYWRGSWWTWTGLCFRPLPDCDLESRVASYLKNRPDTEDSVSVSKVRNVLLILKAIALLPHDLDPPAWVWPAVEAATPAPKSLALQNGILGVNALRWSDGAVDSGLDPALVMGEVLRPATPAFFSMAGLPVSFDPASTCPRWVSF
ncbi:MAG TPA: hypothetical protein VM658_15945, partial [bacterium]|nr:hypothetical protein [bacterium]